MRKRINNYSKMRGGNKKIKIWLGKQGYENIHLFPHSRFMKGYNIDNNEFDGVCCDNTNHKLVLFQCKASKVHKKLPKKLAVIYRQIAKDFGIRCLWLNSVDRKGVFCYE